MNGVPYGTSSVEKYEKVKCIGSGTYGCVYEAKHKETGEVVALKKIKTLTETDGVPITTIREIMALKSLQHPNLVQLKEVVISRQKDDDDDNHDESVDGVEDHDDGKQQPLVEKNNSDYANGSIYLVLEYVPHDLTGLIQSNVNFSELAVKHIMRQLIEALQYMHNRDVVHRDIKSSNILLTADHTVKVADYGLARSMRTKLNYTNKVVLYHI
jgi:cyclin-dependent kinase 12/13